MSEKILSHNIVYETMRLYGYCELLMRLRPITIFGSDAELRKVVNLEVEKVGIEWNETIRRMLSELYAIQKLKNMGMKLETDIKNLLDKGLAKLSPIYMKFGLLVGKGFKQYDNRAAAKQVEDTTLNVLLALIGRIYYSVIIRGKNRRVYISFHPSNGCVNVETALHVKWLVNTFENICSDPALLLRLGNAPDIAKPYIVALLLDQNALYAITRELGGGFSYFFSYVELEGDKNFRHYDLIPLSESVNLVIALRRYQKPLTELVRELVRYDDRSEEIPSHVMEILVKLSYALRNRDPMLLAEVNLELLNHKEFFKYALPSKELKGICEVLRELKT